MNTKLEVIKLVNEDVISTSSELICSHLDKDHCEVGQTGVDELRGYVHYGTSNQNNPWAPEKMAQYRYIDNTTDVINEIGTTVPGWYYLDGGVYYRCNCQTSEGHPSSFMPS